MEQKILVWLDKKKILQPTIEKILQKKPGLEHLFDNFYIFPFNPMEFVLAEAIHDRKRRRNEDNIQRNLYALLNLFAHIHSINDYPNEKHRTEERVDDMEHTGVGFSCLFMNKFLDVPWERISPIVRFEKRPDFIGKVDDKTYFFEAKGTTQSHKITSKFDEAEKQKNADGLPPSDEKFSFVTFVPNKEPSFPSTIFVSDPPSTQIPPLDLKIVILMHYENVLYYANLDKTLSIYLKMLKEEVAMRISKSYDSERKGPFYFDNLKMDLIMTFYKEKQKLDSLQHSGLQFIGKTHTIQTNKEKFKVFCGIEEKIITDVINLKTDIQFINSNDIISDEKTAIFSDGSILHIDQEYESKKTPITNRYQKIEQMTKILEEKSLMDKFQNVIPSYDTTEQKVPMLVTTRK